MEYPEIAIICYSLLSCLFSFVVIGTILFFKSMRKGNFLPIILYMSVSDAGLNLASSFGFPASESPACWIQGLIQNYFALTGWFWTTVLTYRVYCFVRYGRCKLKKRYMHLICWVFPLFLTFIPLTTTDYGNNEPHAQTCVYVQRAGTAEWWVPFWAYTTFFGWFFLCIVLMVGWQIITYIKYRNTAMKEIIVRTYDKVYLYPIAMVGCWTLSFFCNALAQHPGAVLYQLNIVFAATDGILCAVIFMVKSEEARRRWAVYFAANTKRDTFDVSVDPTIRLDFECDEDDDEIDGDIDMRVRLLLYATILSTVLTFCTGSDVALQLLCHRTISLELQRCT
jgi:hypothetical protein